MGSAARATTGPEWDGHLLLVHDSDVERQAGVAAWVQRGLTLGEKILYTEVPVEPRRSVIAVLEAQGVDAVTALAEGRLAVLPPAEFFPPEGQRQVVDRALAEGFPAVRLSAETPAALAVFSPRDYLSVEEGMDRLVRTLPVSAMCQYARNMTTTTTTATGPQLRDAVGVHVPGIRGTWFSTDASPLGLVLRGEVDAGNADVLDAAVAAFTDVPPGLLCLDLTELSFLDVAACRALARASRNFRESGGHLLLVAPSPPVERIMRLLGLGDLPGFELVVGAA
ncbi:MAG TPA: MEDS domain-containing protein [Geodermatophilus sp.]|nr:MEDS domain-containing protein [Geodermatophilus sp.]